MIFFLCCHIADRMFQFLFCTIFGHVTQIKSNNEFKQQNSTFDIRQFICIRRRHIIMVSILVRVGLPVSRLSSFFLLSITVFLILKISYFYNWVTEIKDVKMFSFFTIHYLTSIQKIYNSLTKWTNKNWRHDTFITYGNIW